MNLSPEWAARLRESGHDAFHWSEVGDGSAPDEDIASWANKSAAWVLTADRDFGALLFANAENGPSVVQLRAANLRVTVIGDAVAEAIEAAQADLEAGAFLTFDGSRARLRALPF